MIKGSKYAERFKNADLTGATLTGDILIVEVLQMDEIKTASGIVLASAKNTQVNTVEANLPVFVQVLAAGQGYYNEATGEDVKLDAKPGDILLVGQNSVKRFGAMGIKDYQPFDIGVMSEAETQWRFQGTDGLKRFLDSINRETPEQV